MKILTVGLSHKTAPVELREKLSFDKGEIPACLASLVAQPAIDGGVILSTCNRVEIYTVTADLAKAFQNIQNWLAQNRQVERQLLDDHLYMHEDLAACRHGFRVAASLDSMMVGEPQILGQLKEAYQEAVAAKTTNFFLNKYFQATFSTAKRVRSETTIAENAVSISYAAVELAKKIFGDLSGHSCLLIGAGEMCELAARHMIASGVTEVLVTNRTESRAANLATQLGGQSFPLPTLAENLHRADIILASTGSPDYLISAQMVKDAVKRRRHKPMFFIDIAVPRDLDPEIASVAGAYLFDIDDLEQTISTNKKIRDQAAAEAELIIDAEIINFTAWQSSLTSVPTIVALKKQLEDLRDQQLAATLANWPDHTAADKKRVEDMARLMVNKILHNPMTNLRKIANEEDAGLYVDTVRKLFSLD